MTKWGVFAVSRGIWGDEDFAPEPYTEREAWLWLISGAAYKARRVFVGRTTAMLERGEFFYSLRFLETKWKWGKNRVSRFLKRLVNIGMIVPVMRDTIKVYSIKNYNKFQVVGLPERDTNGTPADTRTGHERDTNGTKKKHFEQSEKEERSILSDLTSDPPNLVGPKLKKKPTYSRDFEDFWKAYPTDRNMAKIEAFKQWAKLSDEDRRAAIAAVPAYKSWASKQRDYRTLHAVRFLSQRRFDGYAPPPGVILSIEDKRIRDAELAATNAWEAELEAARIRQGA